MAIGYVGLGAMGRALATHLAHARDLIVWDLDPAAIARLVGEGAQAALSLADLGACCDIVVLCLPKSANVREVLFGAGGLASVMRPGTVVVDQTSGLPAETRAFAAELAAHGIALVDAPVAGGVPSAVAGQITIMASGPDAAFEAVHGTLCAMTPKVFRCSAHVGDGQALKAINNLANAANRVMTLEMLAVGRRLGLEAGGIADALNAGEGRSFMTLRLLPAIVERRSSTDFALELMVKDLKQAAALAIEAGSPTPISDTARGVIHVAFNLLGPKSRLDDVVSFMESITGVRFVDDETVTGPAEKSLPLEEAASLVTSGVAACNRFIILENAALALHAGLEIANFCPVLESGSASSEEAVRLFDGLLGRGEDVGPNVGEMLDCLTQLAGIGEDAGIPLLMTNQIRAQCLACANTLGAGASRNDLTSHLLGMGRAG